ncbi:MAG: DUF2760 domain-containing protein [Desulfotignum sp.]|nr:DUF2760 domain-containing protein [Desulfotignum sp.]
MEEQEVKRVDRLKRFRKTSFWTVSFFMLAVSAGIGAGIYYGLDWAGKAVAADSGKDLLLHDLQQIIVLMQGRFVAWVLPAVAGTLLILGWIFWLILGVFTAPVLKTPLVSESPKTPSRTGKKDFLDQKIEQERKQRLFLNTLSVLQREGRLLDFFDENLARYSDEQIGAAVRSIQEDCKQAMKKYIDPRPVVDADEGQEITIEPGFDMDAVNLVGNVAGDPPFKGTVKHRGWKAGKKEIPKLADIQDSAIITPAEIEIGDK